MPISVFCSTRRATPSARHARPHATLQRRNSAFCCWAVGHAVSWPHWPEQMRARHSCDSSQPNVMQRRTSSPVGRAGSCCSTTSRVPAFGVPASATLMRAAAAASLPATCETSASIRSTSGSFCTEAAFASFVSPRFVGDTARLEGLDARSGWRDDALAGDAGFDAAMAAVVSTSGGGVASTAATVSITALCGSFVGVSEAAAATAVAGASADAMFGGGVTATARGGAGAATHASEPGMSMDARPATAAEAATMAAATIAHGRCGFEARGPRLREPRGGASMLDRMLTGPQSGSRDSSAPLRPLESSVGRRLALVVSWFKPLSPSKSSRHGDPPAGRGDSIDACPGYADPKSFVTP